jgi:hypothetical protein
MPWHVARTFVDSTLYNKEFLLLYIDQYPELGQDPPILFRLAQVQVLSNLDFGPKLTLNLPHKGLA